MKKRLTDLSIALFLLLPGAMIFGALIDSAIPLIVWAGAAIVLLISELADRGRNA